MIRTMSELAATAHNDARPASADPDLAAIARRLEALLISAERPVSGERFAAALKLVRLPEDDSAPAEERKSNGKPSSAAAIADATGRIAAAVAFLNEEYERGGRAFRIEEVAGGYRVMTLPEFAEVLAEFHRSRLPGRLSRAAVETLAIIAYKQPITRAQLEAIRGVSCGEVLRSLMERRIITIKGRAEELGRPMLYGTTRQFLDLFGLASIADLPTAADTRPA